MVYHWLQSLKQMLVCSKTLTSRVKKWESGAQLQELVDSVYDTPYWYYTIPPREFARRTGRTVRRKHLALWRKASTHERLFWQDQQPEVHDAAVATLAACEDQEDEREGMLAKLRKSRVRGVRGCVGGCAGGCVGVPVGVLVRQWSSLRADASTSSFLCLGL
jgi:hypothetical protein